MRTEWEKQPFGLNPGSWLSSYDALPMQGKEISPNILGKPAAITAGISPPLKKERNEQKYENKNCLSIR